MYINQIKELEEIQLMIEDLYNKENNDTNKSIYYGLMNLAEEIKDYLFAIELAKFYIKNHSIEYNENNIECVKTDEYFNPYWVIDILNQDYENLDYLIEMFRKEKLENEKD